MAPARGRLLLGAGLTWLVTAGLAAGLVFFGSSRTVVVASHDTVVRPTTSGYIVVRSGPVLPDLRMPTDRAVGVDLTLGKTEAATTDELIDRYALIASQPEGQIVKVQRALEDMAWGAALWGAVLGLLPVGLWVLVGGVRRRELIRAARRPQGVAVLVVLALVVLAAWRPWASRDPVLDDQTRWPAAHGVRRAVRDSFPGVRAGGDPCRCDDVPVRRLIGSAVDSYRTSKTFYARAAAAAAGLDVREARDGETVAVLVSDRRQRRHGGGGRRDCGRRRCDGDPGCWRRHVGRGAVGGVQPGLTERTVLRLRPLGRRRQPRPGDFVSDYLESAAGSTRGRRLSTGRVGRCLPARTTRARAGWELARRGRRLGRGAGCAAGRPRLRSAGAGRDAAGARRGRGR
ncbi:MAG: hypothetical protein R2734_20730 [Nocardioides sp.]